MNISQLNQLLMADLPSAALRANEADLFTLIPPLEGCKGFCQHNPWHIYDVYDHILKVVDMVPQDLTARTVALFHDVGKPATFHADEAGIGHFYGHWEASVQIFDAFAAVHIADAAFARRVSKLIFYHDINFGKLSEEQLNGILQKFSPEEIALLFAIKQADLLAQNPKFHGLLTDLAAQEVHALETKRAMTVTHHMNLRPAPFAMMQSGQKTIELRLYDEKRQTIRPGDTIVFTNTDRSGATLQATVLRLHRFDSFQELYAALPLTACGYTAKEAATAHPSDMESYYSSDEQARHGVVGIELAVIGKGEA